VLLGTSTVFAIAVLLLDIGRPLLALADASQATNRKGPAAAGWRWAVGILQTCGEESPWQLQCNCLFCPLCLHYSSSYTAACTKPRVTGSRQYGCGQASEREHTGAAGCYYAVSRAIMPCATSALDLQYNTPYHSGTREISWIP
jgi:hypothetical protein